MKLVQDLSPGAQAVQVNCVYCGKRFTLSQGYIDVEGKPFIDYYCRFCRNETVYCRNLDRAQRDFD